MHGFSAVTTSSGDPVVAAVGDMACDRSDPDFDGGAGTLTNCRERAISSRVYADASVDKVLGLGDYQYECGDPADYDASYDPTWGRLNPLMSPTAGNHEYKTGVDAFGARCPSGNSTATTYFNYFGGSAHPSTGGHFSFDMGSWHLIALNSNCVRTGSGGCGATSPQTRWLKADLAATTKPCIAAFWHHPRFNGKVAISAFKPWWDALYAAHADVVLNGHVHNYQRFAALSPTGARTAAGITEYIVGTGGETLHTQTSSALVYKKTFGYLRMTLHSSGWSTQFIDASGDVLDTSSGTCHTS
jgi:acid phosphatase type 7